MTDLPARTEIDPRYTFDLDSIFPTVAAWEAALEELDRELPRIVAFRGRLAESGATLLAFLDANADYEVRLNRVWLYAHLRQQADAGDEEARSLVARMRDLVGRASADTAWEHAEVLEITPMRFAELLAEEPGLRAWERHFQVLDRRRPHTRSAEVEAVLRQVDDLMASVATHQPTLDRELAFDPIKDEAGALVEINLATLPRLSGSPDRETRRQAHESYDRSYRRHRGSFAAFLQTEVKRRVLEARARNHPSTLEAALFDANVPRSVFETTLEAFERHRGVWHRYWEVKRRALGLERLRPYDLGQRLAPEKVPVPYERAVDWVVGALRPMGEAYSSALQRGLTAERWVDVYPSAGKVLAEYSLGTDGTRPFILTWYRDDLTSASTLAHESGHSMHTLHAYSWQPHQYRGYGVVEAEVAANFHQAMLRAHLLQTEDDPAVQAVVLEEELGALVRYLLRMPVRARLEAEIHALVERGKALEADWLTARFAELNAEAHGPAVEFREEDGIAWADAIVLHRNFASFQYILGTAGGQAIAERVLAGERGAVEGYLAFISAGKSLDPLDALRLAGVDFSTPDPIERAFAALEDRVSRLERLVTSRLEPPESA